jgi:hypothetical protein
VWNKEDFSDHRRNLLLYQYEKGFETEVIIGISNIALPRLSSCINEIMEVD